jgi:hypothetical protein
MMNETKATSYFTSKENCQRAIVFLLSSLLLLVGCDSETITVPSADSTPPIASMSVVFTNRGGSRETLELTSDSNPAARDLSPEEPIAALASGRDEDGGVKNITIGGDVTIFCSGSDLGKSLVVSAQNPSDASPGETVATARLQEWTFDPTDECPNSGIGEISVNLVAIAENFHGGTDTTASIAFTIRD